MQASTHKLSIAPHPSTPSKGVRNPVRRHHPLLIPSGLGQSFGGMQAHQTALYCPLGATSHRSMYTSGMFFKTFLTLYFDLSNSSDRSSRVAPSGIPRSATRTLLTKYSFKEPLYRAFEPFSGRVEGQGA